jgi:lysophospholipase L1-like esterase
MIEVLEREALDQTIRESRRDTVARYLLAVAIQLAFLIGIMAPLSPGHQAEGAPVSAAQVVYVALGESLTYGHGTDHPDTQSYPAVLARHLPQGARFLNLGVDGNTMAHALATDLPVALAARPTLATVWLGGNDVGPTAVTELGKQLDQIVGALQRVHARVFVANYPDLRRVPGFSGPADVVKATLAYDKVIAAVAAKRHVPLIDVWSATNAIWGHPQFVYTDGIHLTAQGYAHLAQVFYRVMHSHGAL